MPKYEKTLVRVLVRVPSIYVGWNGFVMHFSRSGKFGNLVNCYSASQAVLFLATFVAVFPPDLRFHKSDASDTRQA